MDGYFSALRDRGLVWLPEHGIGYYPVRDTPYDAAYFSKYQGYAATERGRAITAARIELVRRFHTGPVLDVGIGCGDFLETHGDAVGFDVNPTAVAWLTERGRLWAGNDVEAATFWDSLEHIADPTATLEAIQRWAFVSVPIVRDPSTLSSWKHFRPDEHCWYFTSAGFVHFMHAHGFELRHRDDVETRLGREDIGTFVFERTA